MAKRIKFWLIAAALCAVSAAGVTVAFMFKKAEKTNLFVPAEVSCAVHEKTDGSDVTGIYAVGGEKTDIRAENTGNVKEYLRLKLVSYYVDANGIVAGTASHYPTLTLKNGWIAGADHTYYYPLPTDPGGMTGILCEPVTLERAQLADGKTVYQVIELIAEAVQAEPVTAVEEAWGVTVTNNMLTAVP